MDEYPKCLVRDKTNTKNRPKNEPYATRTYFGWALSGVVVGSLRHVYSHFAQTGIEHQIEDRWQVASGDADNQTV